MEEEMRGNFCAKSFVDVLLLEGNTVRCDDSNENFRQKLQLPPYYDEKTFKKGQQFFRENILALFFSKLLGLMTILAIPDLVQVLKYTQLSGTPIMAFRRYLSTLFHMCIWYEKNFDQKMWLSLEKVREKHNSTSKRSFTSGFNSITQKNMALTQFGFMGYAISKSQEVGIHNPQEEELVAFIHVWRVIGYLMGVEERFNICRESLEETRSICNQLIERVFKPEIEQNHLDYLEMSGFLLDGMWTVMPFIEKDVFLHLVPKILSCSSNTNNNNNNNNNERLLPKLNFFQRLYIRFITFNIFLLKYTICRLYHNCNFRLCLWFMRNFPFVAYLRFGKSNSHVKIIDFHKNGKR